MRKTMDLSFVFCLGLWLMTLGAGRATAEVPLAEQYLLDGKLAEGARALEGRLKEAPKDDQARFGLGVLQFLQTFEHLGAGLYKYGLRTEKAFHLLRVDKFEPPGYRPLDQVKDQIRDTLYEKAIGQRFEDWLSKDLRERHSVEVFN